MRKTVHGKPDAVDPPVRFVEGWGTQCCSQHPRPLPTLPALHASGMKKKPRCFSRDLFFIRLAQLFLAIIRHTRITHITHHGTFQKTQINRRRLAHLV